MLPLILALFLVPTFCSSAALPGEGEPAHRIGKISVFRKEVFDDSAGAGWVLDAANRIHVVTKESRIRSMLLFREGDAYDPEIIDESARILRSMPIIGDVEIRTDTLPGGIVDVTVTTADRWTLGLNGSFKRDGGITAYNLAVSEENFLGNAQSFTVGYSYSTERRPPHGVDVTFSDPHLLDEWWRLRAQYISNEFQDVRILRVERPFYSDASRWSGGMYVDGGRNRVRTYTDGALVREYDIHQENQQLWGALSSVGWPKFFIGPSYIRSRTRSDSGATASWDNLDLISFSLGVMSRSYYKSSYLDNFGRTEDVPLGFHGNTMFGWNAYRPAEESPRYYAGAGWQHALRPVERWYLEYAIKLTGYLTGKTARDATASFSTLQHVRISDRHLIVFRGNLIVGKNWWSDGQLILGSPTGLRGYPAYGLSGDRQVLANLEHRFFSDYVLWIFRFGTALFVDAGTVWSEGQHLGDQRIRSSAGFGLRIENAKKAGSGVLRIDFAFNFEEHRFAQVIISSSHLFHAFQRMEYGSPIVAP